MADWLLSFAAVDEGEVGVAIETPRGPVVESLMERGFAVHSINPKQLDRFPGPHVAGGREGRPARRAGARASARRTDPHFKLAPGAAEAATTHVRLVAERLALVNRQGDHARRELDRLVHLFAEAAPADDPNASTEDDPSSTDPPDAAILLSLPGIGTKVLATLLAEGSDAVRRRDYNALRCLCGVAPVTRRSGKSMIVTRRQAAHDRLRDAAYHWARAAQRDPVSHDKYRSLRARGYGHARALRSVADRLLNVACAMPAARAGPARAADVPAPVSTRAVSGARLHERNPQAVALGVRTRCAAGRSFCRGHRSAGPVLRDNGAACPSAALLLVERGPAFRLARQELPAQSAAAVTRRAVGPRGWPLYGDFSGSVDP